jgi:fructose-1,6-bisphosphatase/inositol monophosphatase family enzyme
MRLDYELEVAKKLALRAGNSLRSFHSQNVQIGHSTRFNAMVTIPDLIADDIIVSGLQYAFPNDVLCSEQTPFPSGRFESDRLWLVDALDGNTDFVEQGNQHAISIGLVVCGRPVLGVVYNPSRGELFAGSVVRPTTLNGVPVDASRAEHLAKSRISMPRPEWAYSTTIQELPPVRPVVSTSYELARVAAGMEDGFFSVLPVREWSTCAGVALVRSSGGYATLHGGIDIIYNNRDLTHPLGMIAAGPVLHEPLNEILTHLPSLFKTADGQIHRRRRQAA